MAGLTKSTLDTLNNQSKLINERQLIEVQVQLKSIIFVNLFKQQMQTM